MKVGPAHLLASRRDFRCALDYTLRHSFRIGTRLPEPRWEPKTSWPLMMASTLTLYDFYVQTRAIASSIGHQANANAALHGPNLIMKLVADCPLSQRGSSLIGLYATKLPRPSLAPVTRARRVWVSEASTSSCYQRFEAHAPLVQSLRFTETQHQTQT